MNKENKIFNNLVLNLIPKGRKHTVDIIQIAIFLESTPAEIETAISELISAGNPICVNTYNQCWIAETEQEIKETMSYLSKKIKIYQHIMNELSNTDNKNKYNFKNIS